MASRAPALRTILKRSRPSLRTAQHSSHGRFASSTSQQHVVPPSEQDKSRHDIVVDTQENVKTGFDGSASETAETAFTKQQTDPDAQFEQAKQESEKIGQYSNPLDVSPANTEISQIRDALKEGLGVDTTNSKVVSKGGSAPKNAPGKKYEKESELRHQGSNRGVQ